MQEIEKNFVDSIHNDRIKKETILFISKIASLKNKSVVLEGVQNVNQHLIIKRIKNDSLYVQGYYYNKPMHIDDLCNI